MNVDRSGSHEVAPPLRGLGICWVLYGCLRLVSAASLLLFSATATLMFGALLNRVADPFTLMNIFRLFYGIAIVLLAVCGIIGLLAGLALLAGSRSCRTLAIVAAFVSLSGIPIGTTLGIYTLIVMLPWSALHADPSALRSDLPHLKQQSISA